MIQNYFKIAWRNLFKNKVYSAINIVGLAIGLSVSMLIGLFVMHEMRYDKFQANGNRIYKILTQIKAGDQTINIQGVTSKLAPLVKETNPEVLDFVRIRFLSEVVFKNVQNPAQKFKEKSFLLADPSLFSVFSFHLKTGDVRTIFQNPFSLVISEKAAKKYFGVENPIGKSLLCDGKHLFTITGVAENAPSNSTLEFDFLSSLATYPKLGREQKDVWEKVGAFETYLLLNSENSAGKVEKTIAACGKKTDAFDDSATYPLVQFSSLHLGGGFTKNVNARFVYIFSGIGLLILFLALFNYMSLTTARSTVRAKEVGVRKVVGGSRGGLIQQFYVESVLICALSFGLAFVLVKLALPLFSTLLGVRIDADFMSQRAALALTAGLFLFTAFVAGSYPALLLSRFAPIETLKGKFTSGQGGAALRKGITVFQFAVSAALIICVIVIQKQTNYLKNKDLGFTQPQVLAIPADSSLGKDFNAFKNDLRQMNGVKYITSTSTPFYKGYNAWFTKSSKSKKDLTLFSMTTDVNFFKTVGLKWAMAPVDSSNLDKKVFINESAVKSLELAGNPVGQLIHLNLGPKTTEVGGVLKDFHFTGFREEIKPLVISAYSENTVDWAAINGSPTIYIRFEPNMELGGSVAAVKTLYEKYQAESPFDYYFLDDAFNQTFEVVTRMSRMFTLFTAFAIFIAAMGLFGLIAFAAETRAREIGIRKVLGASVGQIVTLLSKDFILLVLAAFVIAAPLAWFLMNKWLLDFAFRISMSWEIFALAGCVILLVALLTVSFQAVKAAVANPVKSLRTE